MEQIGTPSEVLADAAAKVGRAREYMTREGLEALVIGRQDNFAWLTAGGDGRVVTTSELSFAYLVVTRDRQWLVSPATDGQRFLDEQVAGQGYELVNVLWHEGSPAERVLDLTRGLRTGADVPLAGARLLGRELVDLHYPLSGLDLRRCRWIGRATSAILTRVAAEIQPGMSEADIAARLLHEYALAGMTLDVLILGTDERIYRYRHPLPTGKALERYALLHPAARRWGLHANVTRLVHFGPPPGTIARAFDAAVTIAGHVATLLAPGVRFADVLAEQKRLYAELGYPDEWHRHFQGGITGYTLVDAGRCLDPAAQVALRQAFDYFITVTGAKVEELMLLTEAGVEVASLAEGWSVRRVETPRGEVVMPDMLVRE